MGTTQAARRRGLTMGGQFVLISAVLFIAYTATLGASLAAMNQAHGRYQDLLAGQVEMRSLAFAIQNRLLTASAAEQKFDGLDRPDLVAEVKGYLEEAGALHVRLGELARRAAAAAPGEDELGGLLARSIELYAVAWKGSGGGAAAAGATDAVSAASAEAGSEQAPAGAAAPPPRRRRGQRGLPDPGRPGGGPAAGRRPADPAGGDPALRGHAEARAGPAHGHPPADRGGGPGVPRPGGDAGLDLPRRAAPGRRGARADR